MPAPGAVEFPGQKRRKIRMRGTKQANKDTQNRLRKNLDRLLSEGEAFLPEVTWNGKISWRKGDPVKKTIKEIQKVLDNRHNQKWLSKRMMAKRGDPLAKAWAGSLSAAHDEEITIVGDFNHPSFGKGSFVRRGDGKPLYLAAIQNHHLPSLKMAAWEQHARKGFHFFSWKKGLVCSGFQPVLPEGWLEDVLERSRFEFIKNEEGWCTKDLTQDEPLPHISLKFCNDEIVLISLNSIEKKSKESFIHHLALSMLPPNLNHVLKATFSWKPEGFEGDYGEDCEEDIQSVFEGWIGLTMDERSLPERLKITQLNHIESGLIVNKTWYESPHDAIAGFSGSEKEKKLAVHLLELANGEAIRIDQKGVSSERKGGAVEIQTSSLNHILLALWEDYGAKGLEEYGIPFQDALDLWEEQWQKKKGFNRFLNEIEVKRTLAKKSAVFPFKKGELKGITGEINDLVMAGLIDGKGSAEKVATGKRKQIDSAAVGWSWLVATQRSKGKEWQFEQGARDKGSAWVVSVKNLIAQGQLLIDGEKANYEQAIDEVKLSVGESS